MVRRRDKVNWADPTLLILGSLSEGPKHGYAMSSDIAATVGVDLGPGTLYGAISRLEDQGLIEALSAEGPRRPYRITAEGEALLRTRLASMRTFTRVASARLEGATS